jgi:hypothetical protein
LKDPKFISTGEFLRRDLELRGWNKLRKSNFRFVKHRDDISNLEVIGSHPVRSIGRGEVRPTMYFVLSVRNKSKFPPVLMQGESEAPLWTWSQFELVQKGPRTTPGVVSIKDGRPFTSDILFLVDRFIEEAEKFVPSTVAESILDDDLPSTSAGTCGIVAMLLLEGNEEVAESVAKKAFFDVKEEIARSERPDAQTKNAVDTFGNLFSFYGLEINL